MDHTSATGRRDRDQEAVFAARADPDVAELAAADCDDLLAVVVRHPRDDRFRTSVGDPPVARVDAAPDPPAATANADASADP